MFNRERRWLLDKMRTGKFKNKRRDFTWFYVSIIFCLIFFMMFITVMDISEEQAHLEKDLLFVNGTMELMIFQMEIVNYCANMSNISNEDLIRNFTKYKMEMILEKSFENGN